MIGKYNPISLDEIKTIQKFWIGNPEDREKVIRDINKQLKDEKLSTKIFDNLIAGKTPEQIHSEIESEYQMSLIDKDKDMSKGADKENDNKTANEVGGYLYGVYEGGGKNISSYESKKQDLLKRYKNQLSKSSQEYPDDFFIYLWRKNGGTKEVTPLKDFIEISEDFEKIMNKESYSKYAVISILNRYKTIPQSELKDDDVVIRTGVSLEEANRVVQEHFDSINTPTKKLKQYQDRIVSLEKQYGDISLTKSKWVAKIKFNYPREKMDISFTEAMAICIELLRQAIKEDHGSYPSDKELQDELMSFVKYTMK